jgi:hypothetical protein
LYKNPREKAGLHFLRRLRFFHRLPGHVSRRHRSSRFHSSTNRQIAANCHIRCDDAGKTGCARHSVETTATCKSELPSAIAGREFKLEAQINGPDKTFAVTETFHSATVVSDCEVRSR